MKKALKHQVVNSLYWMGGLKYSGQLISWITTIYIIRLLAPSDYGLMSLSNSIVFLFIMFSELGLGAALVQTTNLNEKRLGQLFGLILFSHFLLSLLIFFGGSLVAVFYAEPELTNIFKALSIIPLLLSFYIIPQNMMLREMDFVTKSKVDFAASIFQAILTLIMALKGFGVWSLVIGVIGMHIISLIGYNLYGVKQVRPVFSFVGAGDLFSFGSYVTGSRILWYLYYKADIFIGGKLLGVNELGVYSTATSLAAIPHEKVMPILNQIAFPAFSSIQSDIQQVRIKFLKSVRLASLFLFPAFFGLAFIAPILIPLVLGQKWIAVIVPMQLICLIMPFRALGTMFTPMLNGVSRADIEFYTVVFAFLIMPGAFLLGGQYGIVGLSLAWIIGYTLVFFVSTKLSLDAVGITVPQYLICLRDPFLAGLIMVIILYGVNLLVHGHVSDFAALSAYIGAGGIGFALVMLLINRKLLEEFIGLFRK